MRFQAGRDDINSIWGLLGLGPARYLLLAAALAAAVAGMVISRRGGRRTSLACSFVPLALAMVALPFFWFTYVAWLMPLLLGIAVTRETQVVEATSLSVSSARRAEALPSSTGPS
jgi:hypothetical protein